ncbi:MAG: ABC transporter ATP-binding protein [Thermoplasmata archaeon]
MAKVELRRLVKRYGDVLAVDRLSLEVRDGGFLVLLGPSGCGKTTTLRMIAGLERVNEGEIFIGGTLVNDLEPKDRNVAMVFQNYALYPHMTVYKNMAFPLENFGFGAVEIHRSIGRAAKLLEIQPLLQRKPTELSGGQMQRVALGRAIVREPQVFLMDEPLSNLDAKLRVHMRAELKKLQKDLGVTTIYVTHDQVEAMTMADEIAILNEGVLQQVAEPNTIYSQPANQFVAAFVGTPPINLIEGTYTSGGVLDAGEFTYPLPAELDQAAQRSSDAEVVMAIRPQDVRVSQSSTGGDQSIAVKVYTTEPLGDMTILDLAVGDTLVKAVVSPDFKAEIDDRLALEFPPDKVYLFDGKTGDALT